MILVVGYGNSMRSDDGIGLYVVGRIAGERLPNVEVKLIQQLAVELVDDLVSYEKIIFVDACQTGADVTLSKIEPAQEGDVYFSHQLRPFALTQLAKSLYNVTLNLYLCTIRGESFEFGSVLSAEALERAKKATHCIREFIVKEMQHA